MFREMRRFKQQLPMEDCIALLQEEKRGVLSVLGDEGYPYGMPMNFWYEPENGKIYFHTAKAGHLQDAIAGCDKVSFCIYDRGYRREGEWAWNVKSVIVFGRIRIVEDPAVVETMTRRLGCKYTDDSEYVEREIRISTKNVRCLELTPEHITGKLVNES